MVKISNFILGSLLFTIGYCFSSLAHADEKFFRFLNVKSEPKSICRFIKFENPSTKFCVAIYNNSSTTLHIKRDDNFEMDVDPTLTLVLFEKHTIEKRNFVITTDGDNRMISDDLKNKEGLECTPWHTSFQCNNWK